jgi:hypothetical protein
MLDELKTKFKEKLPEYIFKGIGITIPFIASLIPYDKFDPQYMFWLAVILIATCFFLIGYILSQRPKDIWLPELGIWKEKRSGHYICPSCKANNKRVPLKETDKGWWCQAEKRYLAYKRGQEPKPASASSPAPHEGNRKSWVRNW